MNIKSIDEKFEKMVKEFNEDLNGKDESDEIWKFDVLRSVRIERRRSTTT